MTRNQSQVTLAVTAFNESHRGNFEWIRECIEPAIHHPLVREIAIVNDGTPDFDGLVTRLSGVPKVRLFHNPENLGVFGNKLKSVELSTSEWVLMCDSDNVMGDDYYDRLVDIGLLDSGVMYSASFARPNFDYRHFCGQGGGHFDLEKIVTVHDRPCFFCLVNTGNWFVNRAEFLQVFRDKRRSRFDLQQPNYFNVPATVREQVYWRQVYDAQDSFYINKTWWLAGNSLHVVPGLEYDHRVDKSTPANYDRSPAEKEALAPIYLLELHDRAWTLQSKWGGLPEYRFVERTRDGAFFYSDEKEVHPRLVASVNMATGEIQRVYLKPLESKRTR